MKKGIKSYLGSRPWNILFFEASTYLFVGTLPLLLKINTIALWILGLAFVFTWRSREGLENLRKNLWPLLGLFLLFGLYAVSLLLSSNTHEVFKDIGKAAPFILIPIFVLSQNKGVFHLKKIYIALGVGLFAGMLICWINILISIISNTKPIEQATYFFKWIYTDINLVVPLDGHPSYFAVLIVFFLSAIITKDDFKELRQNKFKFALLLFPFFLFLIETSSRIGIVVLMVIMLIYIFKRFSFKNLIIVPIVVLLLVLFSQKFDYLGSKFGKVINSNGEIKAERYQRWIEIIKVFGEEDKWFFGVGSGDERTIYNKAYRQGGFDLALKENYNAHNQYLEFFISNGMLGLLVYVSVLGLFAYRTELKNEALIFFVIAVLFSMTESVFGRSQGVILFSFFYSLLVVCYPKKLAVM